MLFLQGHLQRFKEDVQELGTKILQAALALHERVSSTFRKTAVNFHYEFTVRHLANVFQGLLMSTPEVVNTPSKWGKLWLHESERVYADRLVSLPVSCTLRYCCSCTACVGVSCLLVAVLCCLLCSQISAHDKPGAIRVVLTSSSPCFCQDLEVYNKAAVAIAKKYFPVNDIDDYYKKKDAKPLIFCHFSRGLGDKTYDEVSRHNWTASVGCIIPACEQSWQGVTCSAPLEFMAWLTV